jgi:transposase
MENIIMSHKEREQLIVFSRLKFGEISQFEAAAQLKLSTRWIRNKLKRFCQSGAKGLVHKSRNKPSGKRWNESERILAIELLKNGWKGFGPTFAAEKLRELKNIKISKEALRKVMISEKLWKSKQSKSKYRKLRDRKPMLGMMVQLDGSPHDWFEGRADKCTLIVFIDDATSKILHLEFVKSESTIGLLRATKNYITKCGIPTSFYNDNGSVFKVNINNKGIIN